MQTSIQITLWLVVISIYLLMSGKTDGLQSYQCEYTNPILVEFINNNKLIDIWRSLHSDVKQFTWYKPNGQSRPRIDYWLVSNSISKHVTETLIANCPLSDHCIINLKLEERNKKNKLKDYWKFNSQLVKNSEFCNSIKKKLILDLKNDHTIDTPILKWEYLKFNIRKHSIWHLVKN